MAQAAFWPKASFFHLYRWICFDTFFPNCSLNYFVCIVSLLRTTAESLTNQNEVEVQRRCEERQQEIGHMQEILETKIQLLQEVHIGFLCAIKMTSLQWNPYFQHLLFEMLLLFLVTYSCVFWSKFCCKRLHPEPNSYFMLFFCILFHCIAFYVIFVFRRLNWQDVKQKKWLPWQIQSPSAVWL